MVKTDIKFAHINLIAKDWKKLSQFYIDVFDCKPQYPERDLKGEWVDRLTGIKGAAIKGIHLTLPGYEDGPTLEIFEYDPGVAKTFYNINMQGFGHIAFHVENLESAVSKIIEHGGKLLGEIIHKKIKEIGLLTAVYAQDPEGNFLEIQNWSR